MRRAFRQGIRTDTAVDGSLLDFNLFAFPLLSRFLFQMQIQVILPWFLMVVGLARLFNLLCAQRFPDRTRSGMAMTQVHREYAQTWQTGKNESGMTFTFLVLLDVWPVLRINFKLMARSKFAPRTL